MRFLAILLFAPILLNAQSFKLSEETHIEIIGTSTLHDWEMVSEEGIGAAEFTVESGVLKDIQVLTFKMKTKTLKSGKGTMDRLCYEAMKAEDHEWISYVLSDVRSITPSGSGYKVVAVGRLTIAGKSNPATITVNATKFGQSFKFSGEYDLKMTAFEIDPPTAMFGTIKTGDDIKVKFSVAYKADSSF